MTLTAARKSLQLTLQSAHKGYAYDMLQLQIAIEQDSAPLSKSKIDDITRLIQLYMVGVQALQGHEDPRFRFFSKKLQTLMLKKPVADQLRSAANMPLNSLSPQRQRRQQHQIQLMYNQQMHEKHRVRELVQNVEQKLKSYQGIVNKHIKKQEDQIRERIQLRKLKSDSGSVKKFDMSPNPMRFQNAMKPFGDYFDQAVIDKKIEQAKHKNLVATMRHDGI